MKRRIKLTESGLHRIVKESVKRILKEVDGYEKTMLKANDKFGDNTVLGKMRRAFNPKKAQQFDRIHDNADKSYSDAWSDMLDNQRNFPSAADPYQRPSEEDIERAKRDYKIMNKYRTGRYGKRNYGISRWERYLK